jgi:hypothetical protein
MWHGRPERERGRGLMIASIVILPLALLTLVPVMAARRRDDDVPGGPAWCHPESMTAHLAPGAEEYLAWLADHHWPEDEYLDLERAWRAELDPFGGHDDGPVCPGCDRPGNDVWPCHECGLMMHSTCGYGMRRIKINKPYRTRDMRAESVVAEWRCNRCASVVGLDVDRGDEKGRAQ